MRKWIDFYSILQVHHEAEAEVIESAYKRLSKKYHPDLNPTDNTEEKMKLINYAYSILKDPSQRKRFHSEWLSRNTVYNKSNTKKQSASVDSRPMTVIKEYIKYISSDKFKEAYNLISSDDRSQINYNQFFEWQKSVGNIYKIGNYNISLFKTYENYHTQKKIYTKAFEYEIKTKEKNLLNGTINEYSFTKLVVYDKYGWKVFLGYDDLELLTHKFKYLADTKEIYSAMDYWTEYRLKIDDVTSLLNKKGFIQECEKELCRYLRYGSDFSFAVFNFNFPKYSNTGSKETVNDYFKQAAYLMKKHIRDTDTIARWDDNNIIIMFTETTRAGAHKASKKIKTLLTSSILKNICIPKINIAVVEHNGQNITGSIEKCFALLRSADTGEEKIS